MHVVFTGPVVIALVNTADPSTDVQAAVADTDPAMAQEVAFVRCASCWEPMGDRPREHGAPAYRAAAIRTALSDLLPDRSAPAG
ncbi:hypothetical protein [Streptosporangium sp. V21-05]|uniref:hypothetical protein n=1 Tax=Streptosporangium sp. V21-05 TaxID=3446115 RepID=UPI003F53462C